MTALTISQMTRAEKVMAMEALWADLSRDELSLESPSWHQEALQKTEQRVREGLEISQDWNSAKKELRQRFE